MVFHYNHLSSDISTNLMVASIAEELTKTLKQIGIDRIDRNKILANLLEINAIVERSKSPHKFGAFKNQLEEIFTILNEPIHKCWIEKILIKTEQLIGFMKDSEKKISKTSVHQNLRDKDIIQQCFNEWNKTIDELPKNKNPPVTPKHSNVKIIHWDHANSFLSESEVLIVNYSRIRHEKSLEFGSTDLETDRKETNGQPKITPEDIKDSQEGMKAREQEIPNQETKEIQIGLKESVKRKQEANNHVITEESCLHKHSAENILDLEGIEKLSESLKMQDKCNTNEKTHKESEQTKPKNNTGSGKFCSRFVETAAKYDRLGKLEDYKKEYDTPERDLSELDNDLRQYLLKKLSSTSHKRNQHIEHCNKNEEAFYEHNSKRDKIREVFEELKKKMTYDNMTQEKHKAIEQTVQKVKSIRRRDRKSNLNEQQTKTKERELTPTTINQTDISKLPSRRKLNRSGQSNSSPTARTTKNVGEDRTLKKNSNISHATTTNKIHFLPEIENPDQLFKYLGKISYKKLLMENDCLSHNGENKLNNNKEMIPVTKTDQDVKHMETKVKNRTSRRHTKHRSWGDKYLKSEDVEELKTRCQMIRKELESIESKAKFLKSRHRNKKNDEESITQDTLKVDKSYQESILSCNHERYLCTIM